MNSAVYILVSLITLVQFSEAVFTPQCRRCICAAEGCDPYMGTCNDQEPKACGAYQITLPYYCDAYFIDKEPCESDPSYTSQWQACSNSWSCANETIDRYMARYGPGCTPDGMSTTCEHYTRAHKGGALDCLDYELPWVEQFWQTVNVCCTASVTQTCN